MHVDISYIHTAQASTWSDWVVHRSPQLQLHVSLSLVTLYTQALLASVPVQFTAGKSLGLGSKVCVNFTGRSCFRQSRNGINF